MLPDISFLSLDALKRQDIVVALNSKVRKIDPQLSSNGLGKDEVILCFIVVFQMLDLIRVDHRIDVA